MKNCKNVSNYIIGQGSITELDKTIRYTFDGEGVVYLIDHFFRYMNLERKLLCGSIDVVFYVDTTNEPTTEYIDKIMVELKSKIEKPAAIVGIGGGSTLDIAKAVSILFTNPGKAEDYQGWDLVKNKPIYKIAVPTLSGTGSEVTRTAVMTSPTKKLGINSDYSVFDQVILDSTLMGTVPKNQFVYTAMDCYVHCVESLRGSTNDPLTIAYAEKSLELLREIFLYKMNHDKLMVASFFGGMAVANSNVGICHPLSYGLSLVLGYHHGEAISICFNQLIEYYPEVAEFRKILNKYDVRLPKKILRGVSDNDIERMITAVQLNEKPLTNAFGKDWKIKFSRDKIKELFMRM